VALIWWQFRPRAQDYLQRAQIALQVSDFAGALTASEEAIRLGENSATSRLIAGEAALRLGRHSDALTHFKNIDDAAGPESLAARLSAASIMINLHQIGRAEEQLRRGLLIDPANELAHRLLSDSLGLQGRRWESIPHLLKGIRTGDINLQSLCYLADTDRTVELSEDQLAAIIQSDNPKCWLGAACIAVAYRKFERAEELIRMAIAMSPTLIEAHARLGKLLLSQTDDSIMPEWETSLPDDAGDFPDIWFVRSQWCVKEKSYELAAACLYRTLALHPSHSAANHQMAHVLSVLGRPNDAKPFRERGQKLSRLATLANEVYSGDSRSTKLKEAAELTASLGRVHEAMAWAIAAQFEHPRESWPAAMQRELETKLSAGSVPGRDLSSNNFDFAELVWSPPGTSDSTTSDSPSNVKAASFRDVSAAVGIDFRYENAEDLTTEGRLMFEYTGGGVGVLDYDHDGWPDLYFTQAGALPPFQMQTQAIDALYRNLAERKFVDISEAAYLQNFGFGQGVAAGDVNNDGFADLYVANIDGNRLYLNLGDGTFSDVTRQSGIGHGLWTTSVAIADLNGDSIPDIYDVTFLSDEDVFDRVCEEDGIARSCAPAGFAAADDFIYRGAGNGSFDDISEAAGIRVPEGDGLGILVADFAANGTPSIFIANDGRANFYFTRNMTTPDALVFSEDALTCGLALDRDGRAQACMGIASADFDDDGNWDLFVTNFFNESNTIYTQFSGEIFGDSSQQAGIREPSLGMLGFGTQAIDGELDGLEDLMVGNGHVDNFQHKDIPYRMPLEYYRNTGKANFKYVPSTEAGQVFERQMLSRSMAIIDWNRDGLAEVAVSRLDDPAMLLENTTASSGNYLAVQIVGVRSSRDATTARLTASVNGRKIVRQFTAGDGYQASNEKQVIFGLGSETTVSELKIDWPGGQTQTFRDLKTDQTIILREGEQIVWPVNAGQADTDRS